MKRTIVRLVFLSIIICIIYSTFGKVCDNYRIVDVSLSSIYLQNDSSHGKRKYYLMKVIPKYCNCKRVFMGGGREQGLGGIVDSIHISIRDSLGHDITAYFKGWNFEHQIELINKNTNQSLYCYTKKDVNTLERNINSRDRSETGLTPRFDKLFYIESNRVLPKNIYVSFFSSESIERKVDNYPKTSSINNFNLNN